MTTEEKILEIMTGYGLANYKPYATLKEFSKEIASLFEQQCKKQLSEELYKFFITLHPYNNNGEDIIDEYLKQKGLPL